MKHGLICIVDSPMVSDSEMCCVMRFFCFVLFFEKDQVHASAGGGGFFCQTLEYYQFATTLSKFLISLFLEHEGNLNSGPKLI